MLASTERLLKKHRQRHTRTQGGHTKKKVQPGLTFTATHKTTSSVHIPGGLLSKPSETIKTTSTVITENPFSYATVCFGIVESQKQKDVGRSYISINKRPHKRRKKTNIKLKLSQVYITQNRTCEHAS